MSRLLYFSSYFVIVAGAGLLIWLIAEAWSWAIDSVAKLFRIHREIVLFIYYRKEFKTWLAKRDAAYAKAAGETP